MIKSAAKKTMGAAKKLADELCQRNASNGAASDSGKVYAEWSSTFSVEKLMNFVGKKKAYVSLAPPYVVVIFAKSREEAHQVVEDELG